MNTNYNYNQELDCRKMESDTKITLVDDFSDIDMDDFR